MPRRKKNKDLQLNLPEVKMAEDLVKDSEILETLETELDKARLELEKVKKELEEKKLAIKNSDSRENDAKEVAIVEKQIAMRSHNEGLKAKIQSQKEYDNVKVTGRFMNRRAPGHPVKLPYIKYEDDPVKWYEFLDGKVYTIPRGFADQLNGGDETNPCYYTPTFTKKTGAMDPDNPESQIDSVDTSNKKYAFVALGY